MTKTFLFFINTSYLFQNSHFTFPTFGSLVIYLAFFILSLKIYEKLFKSFRLDSLNFSCLISSMMIPCLILALLHPCKSIHFCFFVSNTFYHNSLSLNLITFGSLKATQSSYRLVILNKETLPCLN